MDLIDEYALRTNLDRPIIKYADKATLALRSRKSIHDLPPGKPQWLSFSLDTRIEPNRPPFFHMLVTGNPTFYATPDFSHCTYQHEQVLIEDTVEFDDYESKIGGWADSIKKDYVAVKSNDAIGMCWQMYCANYDRWFANFLPHRMIKILCESISGQNQAIFEIEQWMRQRHEKVFSSWVAVKKTLDNNHYADWLAEVVNRD